VRFYVRVDRQDRTLLSRLHARGIGQSLSYRFHCPSTRRCLFQKQTLRGGLCAFSALSERMDQLSRQPAGFHVQMWVLERHLASLVAGAAVADCAVVGCFVVGFPSIHHELGKHYGLVQVGAEAALEDPWTWAVDR
jgi:hypothetical protein